MIGALLGTSCEPASATVLSDELSLFGYYVLSLLEHGVWRCEKIENDPFRAQNKINEVKKGAGGA